MKSLRKALNLWTGLICLVWAVAYATGVEGDLGKVAAVSVAVWIAVFRVTFTLRHCWAGHDEVN
jgi:hypothetical protein